MSKEGFKLSTVWGDNNNSAVNLALKIFFLHKTPELSETKKPFQIVEKAS